MRLNNDLMVTTSRDILEKLTTEDAPEKFILALGYAGWSAGQLEKEMAENSWLMIPADNNIIFEMSHAEKWQGAAHAMGIEVWQLSPEAGHA
jgi:putative transcriptional regulator